MKLLQISLVVVFSAFSIFGFSQTNVDNSGSWDRTNTWSSGIPSGSGTNVTWSQNKTVTYPNATIGLDTTSTIGNMTMDNSDVLTIGNGTNADYLILGASGTPKDLTANNTPNITVKSGSTLEIWGDVVIKNHLNLTVESGGTLIIHGSISMDDAATVNVSGSVSVGGSFSMGNSGSVNVTGGSVFVTGNVNVGNATCLNLSSGGTFTYGPSSTCDNGSSPSCGGGGTFCGNALPITLSSFNAIVRDQTVELKWSTSSEVNFDHFVLERSPNGFQFFELTKIKGSGTSNVRKDYFYTDNNPLIGNSYYRLTSIDFDGYTEVFSNSVVRVTVNAGKNFYVVPNPIEGNKLKGGINFDAVNTEVVIYNRMGIELDRYKLNGTEFELQIPNLVNGVYFAQLQADGYTKSVRFVVNQ